MKRCLLGLLVLIALAGCARKATTTLTVITDDSTPLTTVDISVTVSDIQDDKEALNIYLTNLQAIDYEINQTAVTDAKKGIISYQQSTITNIIKKGDSGYYYTDTRSSLVNRTHTAYFNGSNVSYKDRNQDYKDVTLEEYRAIYGIAPFDYSLMGFIANDETISSISRERIDDYYLFTVELDVEKATNNTKIQMKEFGDLSDYPIFHYLVVTVKMAEDFSPISTIVESEYEVSVNFLGNMTCKQVIEGIYKTENISDIPNK